MSLEGHLDRLVKEHKVLDEQIKHLTAHPGYDTIEVHELKKQKLMLKDRIDILRKNNGFVHNVSGESR